MLVRRREYDEVSCRKAQRKEEELTDKKQKSAKLSLEILLGWGLGRYQKVQATKE